MYIVWFARKSKSIFSSIIIASKISALYRDKKGVIWMIFFQICFYTSYILWPEKYSATQSIYPSIYIGIKLIKTSMNTSHNLTSSFIKSVKSNIIDVEIFAKFFSLHGIHFDHFNLIFHIL